MGDEKEKEGGKGEIEKSLFCSQFQEPDWPDRKLCQGYACNSVDS